ncbi:MAG TPA: MurR/RpiR family transcriptional regulator [Symbiobacteriaceae bacterium]|nr:MurR/RpiR family transcriptional regulator [Symbiobacteriaceae bacterium]
MAMDDRDLQLRLNPALVARVQGIRRNLSDKEQGVANFLLEDPKEFISLSISALAARCGVSETVIIRLYRKLGYEGFHQFKIDIAQSLTEAAPDTLGDLRTGDDMETIKRKVFAITRQALEESLPSVDSEQLVRVRDILLQAKRVVIIAFGGSAPVGLDLAHKLLKQGIIATLQTDSHMQLMSAAVMGPGDVLVAITHSGNSRDIVEALETAKQRKVATVVITGFPHSPAANAAEIALFSTCRETKYQTDALTSRIVQLAVIDALYVAMTFAHKEQATAAIHDTSVAAARKKL